MNDRLVKPTIAGDAAANIIDNLSVDVIIPLRSSVVDSIDFSETLIRKTLESIRDSRYISRVFVCADSEDLLHLARKFSVVEHIPRPVSLSGRLVRVAEVLSFAVQHLEEHGETPDIVVPLEITYPFRPSGLIDDLVRTRITEGADTVVAAFTEHRPCWLPEPNDTLRRFTDLSIPRTQRQAVHVGVPSLGCATAPDFLKSGERLGGTVVLYPVTDPLAAVEIRSRNELHRISEQFYWAE